MVQREASEVLEMAVAVASSDVEVSAFLFPLDDRCEPPVDCTLKVEIAATKVQVYNLGKATITKRSHL